MLTDTQRRVLRVLLVDPASPRYGYEMMKAAGVKSGTLYPMLKRWQDEGMVVAEWEDAASAPEGRPARKYYRLTGEGVRIARIELAEYTAQQRSTANERRGFGWSPAAGATT
jgi:DNA-binding PadR family transcriptional regulator